jgi:serine/threonine protein phosphatase 1
MRETNARRIVIGDVHGHFDALMALIEAIAPSADDQIYFLGDLIDRGPQSAQVVEFVKQNSYPCLLGNHEQMMLDSFPKGKAYLPALQAWLYNGGQETLDSYGEPGISPEHLDWIQNLPTYLDLGDVWLVHAGVHPSLPIEAQTTHEFCWIRSEFHSMRQPYFTNKLIVTGHTITFTLPGVEPGRIAQGHGWLDIETGAYHPKSGWMTALDLTHKVVCQVNVFKDSVRKLPLSEAATWVSPDLITSNR